MQVTSYRTGSDILVCSDPEKELGVEIEEILHTSSH